MNREIRFEYGFESVNGTVKKVHERLVVVGSVV